MKRPTPQNGLTTLNNIVIKKSEENSLSFNVLILHMDFHDYVLTLFFSVKDTFWY